MSQLIALTVSKRTPSPGKSKVVSPSAIYGFDISDITGPIRRNAANTASYFTTRIIKGEKSGSSENNARVDYEVTETLSAIVAKSKDLFSLPVVTRRGVAMGSETMIFNVSRISGDLTPVSLGTSFFYHEDGDPLGVEYVVDAFVPEIIAATSSGTGNKTPIELIDGTGFPIEWDYADGYNAFVELNANETLDDIANAAPGDYGTLKIIQGVGGPYTLTLPAGALVSNNGAGVLTLAAGVGEHDIASWYVDENGDFNWTLSPQFT